ncbi:hypothetical protein R3P38DRAFT_1366972 [Favolaschia claudopus]|uniref:Secreted protein n=1 Tax=Favolaschia claudopus TaxID=2862362 RepID=A0AAW0DUN7_9AGAR
MSTCIGLLLGFLLLSNFKTCSVKQQQAGIRTVSPFKPQLSCGATRQANLEVSLSQSDLRLFARTKRAICS